MFPNERVPCRALFALASLNVLDQVQWRCCSRKRKKRERERERETANLELKESDWHC